MRSSIFLVLAKIDSILLGDDSLGNGIGVLIEHSLDF